MLNQRRTNSITIWVKADITLNLRESQEMNNFFEGTQNFNNTLCGLIAKNLQFKITLYSAHVQKEKVEFYRPSQKYLSSATIPFRWVTCAKALLILSNPLMVLRAVNSLRLFWEFSIKSVEFFTLGGFIYCILLWSDL